MPFAGINDIRARIEQPLNRRNLQEAIRHQNRVSLHNTTEDQTSNPAFQDHLEFVKALLTEDKQEVYKTLLRTPLRTIAVTTRIFSNLSKIWEGRDPAYQATFIDDSLRDDWDQYRKESMGRQEWKERSWTTYQEAHNSIMVVDLPAPDDDRDPDDPRAQPYYYFVGPQHIIDLGPDPDDFEYVIFSSHGKVYAYDDQHYRVFSTKDGNRDIDQLLSEEQHNLGYCPARWFIKESLNSRNTAVKKAPTSSYTTQLNWHLFFENSKGHLDLYGPYPIMHSFATDCDYKERPRDGQMELYCKDGFLAHAGTHIHRNGQPAKCPICSKKRAYGAGSWMEIEPPSRQNDKADLRNPVGKLDVDRQSLDYNVQEVERLTNELIRVTTGYAATPINDQAVNRKQVAAIYEEQTNTLHKVREVFESAQQWRDETSCRLRYGASFLRMHLSYGHSYYLATHSEILDEYKEQRTAGTDDALLDQLYRDYIETRWKNNPDQLARERLIWNLLPFRHQSKEEIKELYSKGWIEYGPFYFGMNFSTLIARFERENGPLTEFGQNVDFDVRINRIIENIAGMIPAPPQQADKALKDILEAYGIAIRAGAITAQQEDEEEFRAQLGMPEMSSNAQQAWRDDNGVRKPVTSQQPAAAGTA